MITAAEARRATEDAIGKLETLKGYRVVYHPYIPANCFVIEAPSGELIFLDGRPPLSWWQRLRIRLQEWWRS